MAAGAFNSLAPQCATCSLCTDVNEDNRDDEEDDLLVCIKSKCDKKHRIMCRSCMRSSHKKKVDHKLEQKLDPQQFVHLQKWYDMTRVQKVGPNGVIETLVKESGWGVMSSIGAVGGYALADKAVMEAVKNVGKEFSKKQLKVYAEGIVKAVANTKETKQAILKGMVKGQIAISGIMFAVEVGWNLVQYAYDDNITYDEMMRRNKKAGVAHGCGCFGAFIGGSIGLLFGPAGAFIGSALGGAVADLTARQWFDYAAPNDRRKHVKLALLRFHYGKANIEKLLENKEKFNLKELEKRYHKYALENHPDGPFNGGRSDEEKRRTWDEFYSCYSVLLVLCRDRDDKLNKKKK